nr:hypothetical protein [Rhizoctonia sp.]
MKQWDNNWLNNYNWSLNSGISVEIRDFETGGLLFSLGFWGNLEHMRFQITPKSVPNSINGACKTLGVSKKVGLTYLNNSGGFLSPILDKRVTLNIFGPPWSPLLQVEGWTQPMTRAVVPNHRFRHYTKGPWSPKIYRGSVGASPSPDRLRDLLVDRWSMSGKGFCFSVP